MSWSHDNALTIYYIVGSAYVNQQYKSNALFHSYCNKGYANTPQCYVVHTFPALLYRRWEYGYINTMLEKHSKNVLYYSFFIIIVYLYCHFRITILLWFFYYPFRMTSLKIQAFISNLIKCVFTSLTDPKSGMNFILNPVHIWSQPDDTFSISDPIEVFSNDWFGKVLYMFELEVFHPEVFVK